MLSFLSWLILLALLVAAAPVAGLMLGIGCSAVFVGLWEQVSAWLDRPLGCSREAKGSAFSVEFPEAEAVEPLTEAEPRWQFEAVNLPGLLLKQRQRLFRVDCVDRRTGLRRSYAIVAKHAGAAEMKAHLWGEQTSGVSAFNP